MLRVLGPILHNRFCLAPLQVLLLVLLLGLKGMRWSLVGGGVVSRWLAHSGPLRVRAYEARV